MYYYVYDEFVQDPKFERELSQIETRLTDLGISGKIARLALFRDASELIRDEIRKGAKTIVAVGNDLTLRKVIDSAAGSGVAIAIIPIGTQGNSIGNMLGMPVGVRACDVISARMIAEIDSGIVNGRRFINRLEIHPSGEVRLECDKQFTLTPKKGGKIEVRNLALEDVDVRSANPMDGKLEMVLRTSQRSWFGKKSMKASIIPVKGATIICEKKTIMKVDGEPFEAKEFKVKVLPKCMKLIIGRDRQF